MYTQVLIPDLAATRDIDIIEERLRWEHAIAQRVYQQSTDEIRDEAKIELDKICSALEDYLTRADGPRITIGYIPASKLTELEVRQSSVVLGANGDRLSVDAQMAVREVSRDTVRWGVRGHTIAVPFETEPCAYRGKDYALAGESVIEVYERNQWLAVLREAIIRYNNLADEKKRE